MVTTIAGKEAAAMRSAIAVAAALVAVVLAFAFVIRLRTDLPNPPSGNEPFGDGPTGIPVTPPAWWPTPQMITTPEIAIDYVVALLGDPDVVDAFAARTEYAEIVAMEYGVDSSAVTGSPYSGRGLDEAYWIVGVRLSAPLSSWLLTRATGLGEGLDADPYAELGGHEVYMLLDDVGNPIESGYLDFPDASGTPLPDDGSWELEDIAGLSPASTPSPFP
jgi:hypothetical protein